MQLKEEKENKKDCARMCMRNEHENLCVMDPNVKFFVYVWLSLQMQDMFFDDFIITASIPCGTLLYPVLILLQYLQWAISQLLEVAAWDNYF